MREVKIDSSKMLMDCHADKSARNDRKRGFFKQDSRVLRGFVDFHHLQRILGFLMRNRGFQAIGKGVTLAVMTTDNRAESTIYRKKTKSHKG